METADFIYFDIIILTVVKNVHTATTPGRQHAWHNPIASGLSEVEVSQLLFVSGFNSGSSSDPIKLSWSSGSGRSKKDLYQLQFQ